MWATINLGPIVDHRAKPFKYVIIHLGPSHELPLRVKMLHDKQFSTLWAWFSESVIGREDFEALD